MGHYRQDTTRTVKECTSQFRHRCGDCHEKESAIIIGTGPFNEYLCRECAIALYLALFKFFGRPKA